MIIKMRNTCRTQRRSPQQHLVVEEGKQVRQRLHTLTPPPSQQPPPGGPEGPACDDKKIRIRDGSKMKDLGTILRTVTSPINQVLPTPPTSTRGHDPTDRVGRMTLEVQGGRRGLARGAERAGTDRLEPGNMKNGVNTEMNWQPETN
ncbi:hypothetical protein XENORESO_011982 [Xenotaenia resolanae]|uniref:Uncharacterized protein n=1 Tax=Xenotaenia resolanae TaxID=208358 RepID=A0ABV0WWX0_9TELE